MSTAASLEYPAGVILLSFPLTLYTLTLPFAKRYCERVSQSCPSSEYLRQKAAGFSGGRGSSNG
jgi:hypothetical protein